MEYIKNAAKISFRYKRELYENSERGKHIYIFRNNFSFRNNKYMYFLL